MKVTVMGKEYVSGTSKKTGKDFAANVVHVTHKKNGVEGGVNPKFCVNSIWGANRVYTEFRIDPGTLSNRSQPIF